MRDLIGGWWCDGDVIGVWWFHEWFDWWIVMWGGVWYLIGGWWCDEGCDWCMVISWVMVLVDGDVRRGVIARWWYLIAEWWIKRRLTTIIRSTNPAKSMVQVQWFVACWWVRKMQANVLISRSISKGCVYRRQRVLINLIVFQNVLVIKWRKYIDNVYQIFKFEWESAPIFFRLRACFCSIWKNQTSLLESFFGRTIPSIVSEFVLDYIPPVLNSPGLQITHHKLQTNSFHALNAIYIG